MYRGYRSLAMCVGVLAAAAAGPASANLIVNGDFESDLTGWIAVPRVVTETSERYRDLAGATGDTGTGRFVSFGSANDTALGSLGQAIATVVGESYALTFGYGAYTNLGLAQALRVTIGATSYDITTPAPSGDLAKVLQPYAFQFTASDPSTLITFSDRSSVTNSVDGLLDDVRVLAVPLPGAFALLGAGLLAWLAFGLRRTAKG